VLNIDRHAKSVRGGSVACKICFGMCSSQSGNVGAHFPPPLDGKFRLCVALRHSEHGCTDLLFARRLADSQKVGPD
jgi:hypothetical protein